MRTIEKITSRNNPKILDNVKLKDRKCREERGLFAFEGKKLFLEAIEKNIPLEAVYCTESRADFCLEALAGMPTVPVFILTDGVYEKISEEKSPEGIFCVSKPLDKLHKIATIYSDKFSGGGKLMLCELRDPGNLGTVIRTAAAFGLRELILSADCADLYCKKTVRASMGTLFSLPITIVKDPVGSIAALRELGYSVWAAALDHDAAKLTELPPASFDRTCFVVGNEGHGLPSDIIRACGGSIFIPMASGTESLNAASAATVLLWELQKHSL